MQRTSTLWDDRTLGILIDECSDIQKWQFIFSQCISHQHWDTLILQHTTWKSSCMTRTHLQLQSVSNGAFPSSHRELQYLADQERISPAAIKKTTLDKVLQQPGVAVSGVPNGNGKSGLSLFNARSPGIKKNWVHKGRHTKNALQVKCTNVYTCGHHYIIWLNSCRWCKNWTQDWSDITSKLAEMPDYLFILELHADCGPGGVSTTLHTSTGVFWVHCSQL